MALPPWLGSVNHHWRSGSRRRDFHPTLPTGYRPRIVDWYMEGRINIRDLITLTLPLERINEGFDLKEKGESIRSVVLW